MILAIDAFHSLGIVGLDTVYNLADIYIDILNLKLEQSWAKEIIFVLSVLAVWSMSYTSCGQDAFL